MEVETSGICTNKTKGGIWQLIQTATYRFNKTIATATNQFIVTVAIVVYKGLITGVYRMLTFRNLCGIQKGLDNSERII